VAISIFLAFFGLLLAGFGLMLVLNVGGMTDFYASVQLLPSWRHPSRARFVGAVYLVLGLVFAVMILLTFR
jgi:hypothetical protein